MRILLLLPIIVSSTIFAQMEPKATKNPTVLKTHNHERTVDYFWMNQRDSKEVLDYIKSENDYNQVFTDQRKGLIEELVQEFNQRINPNEIHPSFEKQGVIFQYKELDGKDYEQIWSTINNQSKLFIDENERAKGHGYYALGNWEPDPTNRLVALAEDFVGRRNYTITFRNFEGNKFLKDKIEGTDGSLEWTNDGKAVFYVKKDPQTLRSSQLYLHILGQPQSKDQLIYEEKDELFGLGINKTLDNKYILVGIYSSTTSEYRVISANQYREPAQVFLPREKDHLYHLNSYRDGFVFISNKGAKNGQILTTTTYPKSIESCQILIPHDEQVLIENLTAFKDYLVIEERNNGLQKIRIFNLNKKTSSLVEVKEETCDLSLASNFNYETNTLNYSYNSMTTPYSIFSYNMDNGIQKLTFQKQLIDPTFKSEDYHSERIWITANDGTLVPVSLVYKKGVELKNAPLLLYGYSSYGYTLPDVFSPYRLSLLNRGFVYAQVHMRGSKYLGESWYEDGKFKSKKNTFTDFINAAEYLGMKGYCDKNKIYCQGGSAGGLLIGAVINMAPYLFKGAVAQVPFVDVVTTMLDESIPLTVGEYEEWGNPNEEDYYYYMLNYSPYDNVQKMDYPHLYITTGYHDSQVQYWEPLKWVAKLRDYRTNKNLLLFDCEMDAGHGGGSGRSQERLEIAKVYSFYLYLESNH